MSDTAGWWTTEESAHCAFCAQGYAWELGMHCLDCDEPVCPLCVVYAARRVCLCPSCRALRHDEGAA